MATASQFRHEDVSALPRGYKVRTVTHPTGHKVRLAFPPGPRRKGSGKLVSILHPKRENPRTCTNQGVAALILATPIEELLAAKALAANPKQKTREQLERMQAKAVRFLRDVVGDSAKAREIAGLSVAEYAERKKITLTNPKGRSQKSGVRSQKRNRKSKIVNRKSTRRRRKNQSGNGAAKLYTAFHGKEPKEVLEFQQDIIRRKDYAALGKLMEMQLPEIRTAIDFAADNVILAANADGTQLYLIGGNQNIDALLKKTADDSKDFLDLGELSKIIYRTRKDFDRFEEIDYVHKMGENGHEKPSVMYDRLNHQLYIAGGEYQVKREGIVH